MHYFKYIYSWLKTLLTRVPIRLKMGIAFLGFSLFAVIIVGSLAWYLSSQFMRRAAIAELNQHIETINIRLDDFIESVATDLNYLSKSFMKGASPSRPLQEFQTDLEAWERQAKLLMSTRLHYARLTYLSAYDHKSYLNLQRDPLNRTSITNHSGRYSWYFYQTLVKDLEAGTTVISPVEYILPGSAQTFAAFTIAFSKRRGSGELEGILIADIFAGEIFSIIEQVLSDREHYLAGMVDDEGNYLYHSEQKQQWNQLLVRAQSDIFGDHSGDNISLETITGPAGTIVTKSGNVLLHTPLELRSQGIGQEFFFYLSQPGEVVFAPLRKLGFMLLALIFFFAVVALVLSEVATRQLVNPIIDLQKGSDIIAAGDFSHRLNISSGDEIEQLAAKFNAMASFIAERDQELSRYSTDLEQLVDRRTAELEREQQKVLQSEKLASLGEMAAVIAHEIRNSLTSARMLLQVIDEKDQLEVQENESLAVALSALERIDNITTDLLAFSRPSPIIKEQVAIESLLEECVSRYNHHFKQNNIETHIITAPELPEIEIDSKLFQEIIINLLLNSSHAIEQNGNIYLRSDFQPNALTAESQATPLEGSQYHGIMDIYDARSVDALRVIVEDDGPGIPAADLPNIFEPFFTTKTAGTGLGLSLAQRVIEAHGGRITATNNGESGAIFTILLPLMGEL